MKIVGLIVLVLSLPPFAAVAQTKKPASIAELAGYLGADREQVLYAGAKAEGKVVWYTSLAGGSYKEIAEVFEKKYSGVKVESFRASGSELTVKLEEETKARRYIADAIETTEGNLMFMRDGKLLRPYSSPHLKSYPDDAKEPAGKGLYYWALARESYIGFIWLSSVSKFFAELKGRMGISVGETSGKILGAMIRSKGEEFVKKLKSQEIRLYSIDAPALVNVIASGEIVASPAIFQTAARGVKRRAAGVGADGFGADQRGQRRRHSQPAASTCGTAHGGLSIEPLRTASSGKILLWQRREGLWLQEMAPGARTNDGSV